MANKFTGELSCPICGHVANHYEFVKFGPMRYKHICLECANRKKQGSITINDVYKDSIDGQLQIKF